MPSQAREFFIRRNVASQELCDRVVQEIANTQPACENAGLLEYRVTPTCDEIIRQVDKLISASELESLHSNPTSYLVGTDLATKKRKLEEFVSRSFYNTDDM